MENLHAPTVPSGPSSRPLTNGSGAHLSFAELQLKKETTEAELKALSGVLDSVSRYVARSYKQCDSITDTVPSMALIWTPLLQRRTAFLEQTSMWHRVRIREDEGFTFEAILMSGTSPHYPLPNHPSA